MDDPHVLQRTAGGISPVRWSAAAIGDLDGDGPADLGIWDGEVDAGGADKQARCILASTQFLVGVTQTVPETGLCVVSGVDSADPGYGPYVGDFDGDGWDDYLFADAFGYTNQNDDYDGILHIVLGWDIPWTDPAYW